MIPRTLSASSLLVAESCMARWAAEYHKRASAPGGSAANVGTSVHAALENFVKACHMGPIEERRAPTKDLIMAMYQVGYMETFQSANLATEEYKDGAELTEKWFDRTSFDGFEVLSAEQKSTFPIKTSVGEVPFNYIWDRADKLGPNEYRIVDYKTIRLPVTSAGLKEKIQPRAYGLAGQIQFPDAERIFVEFDLLRHERVGIVFTRDDNIATWKFLKASAERIIETDENNPPESLNPDCRYCVRKYSCTTLKKNVMVGGVFSVDGPNEAADRRAEIKYAMDAMKLMADDLDKIILQHAEREQLIEWETGTTKVNITMKGVRQVDSERAANVLGPEIMKRYGQLRIGDIDKMLKGDELTEQQKTELKSLMRRVTGEPGVKVTPVSPIDDAGAHA